MLSWLFAQFSLQSIQMYLRKQLLQLTNAWMRTKVGLPETDNLFVRICSLVDVQVTFVVSSGRNIFIIV